MAESASSQMAWVKTRSAYIWTSILNTPFWSIFNLLPFILYKDLHATPLQITAIIIVKPAVYLFAPYWSAYIEKRKDRLLSNMIWSRILSHLPFFFYPFVDNPWFFIASFGFYMMLAKGTVPAWMEVLKLNVPGISRERLFAYGTSFAYIGSAILPFVVGETMDNYTQSWRYIFPIAAFISLIAVFFKMRIPILLNNEDTKNAQAPSISWKQQILKPWKSAWEVITCRSDFTRYQLGFMLGGSGLIIMQPALPVFFMDNLNLSYTELAMAITCCKGIGFAMASPTWAAVMNRIDIYRFNSWVTFLSFLFPLCLIAAQINLAWLYFAYLLYGVMQAGSEMSWNLSGPLFAKDEDSSVYSSVNVLTVGLRGCFIPVIGLLLSYPFHSTGVMVIGGILCLLSTVCMAIFSSQLHEREWAE